MAKKVIRLTENEVKEVVKGCVMKVINEYNENNNKCSVEDEFKYEMLLQEHYGLPIGDVRLGMQLLEQKLLYEGLIKSFDYAVLCERLKNIGCTVLDVQKTNGTPLVYVRIPQDSMSNVNQLMTLCGWYVINQESNMTVLAPYFGEEKTEHVYNERNGVLFHTNPISNAEKILRQGLVPRSGGKIDRSQDLVHFFFDKDECVAIAPSLSAKDPNHPEVYTLFQIDVSYISSNLRPRFFSDPKYPGAIVTKDNIPPYCIKALFDFSIDPEQM